MRIAALVALATAAAIYLLRLDHVAGLIVDDAWYALLGRALAEGSGYTLISSPVPGLLPPNPPGFAAVLALGFRLHPAFPDNVLVLKSLSVAAMLVTGLLLPHYLTRVRGMAREWALVITLAVVITPAFVFLATSTLMSECVFTALQVAAVLLLDRAAAPHRASHRATIVAGALAAAVVLTRTAGIALPAAGTVLFLWRRQWQRAALFAAVVAICVGPWLLYTATHSPTPEQRAAHGGAHAHTYGSEFWMRWAGRPDLGTIGPGELPARALDGLADIFLRDVGGILVPSLYRDASESGMEVISIAGGIFPSSMGSAPGTMILSVLLSLVAGFGYWRRCREGMTAAELVVAGAIAVIVLWPQPAYRFVLPLTPFLYLYVVTGLHALGRHAALARIVIATILLLNVLDHARYIAARLAGPTPAWLAESAEVDSLFDWMNTNLEDDGHVASTNPALVYLRTGRRGVALDEAAASWPRWGPLGVRYMVNLKASQLPSSRVPYTVLFRSEPNQLWVASLDAATVPAP